MTTKIVTSCKECKFAIYDGKTQTGCEFDLFDKYRKAGIEVLEAYDEDLEFNVIDRICVYSRHISSKTTKEQVLEQVKVKYQVIISLNDNDIDKFSICLDSILNQKIQPVHVTILKPYGIDVEPFKYTKMLMRSGLQWRYEDCINPEFTEADLIDSSLDIVAMPYYVVLRQYGKLPIDFSDKFDYLVNKQFRIFSYMHFDNIEVFPTIYHKQLNGNAFGELLSQKIMNDKELSNLVIEDVWNKI